MAAIITVSKLTHVFTSDGDEPSPALRGVDMEIERGEFVAVLGHNGSGKSTLARHFNAMLRPDSGSVTVGGLDTSDENNVIEIRRRVGMVFQNPDNQIVANVVEEDVAFGPENLGIAPAEIRERVDSALRAVGMYEYRTHAPHLLSGGQKQRVAIAGALAMQPECIVLDEPTAMLDPRGREDVIRIIRSLRDELGVTVILITHHMDETVGCDRIFVMSEGTVAKCGTPREIFSDVALIRSVGLDVPDTVLLMSELNKRGFNLPLEALEMDECAKTISRGLREAGGYRVSHRENRTEDLPKREAASGEKIIETEDVCHTYSAGTPFEHAAIRGIGFEARKGEYIGIIGHTGSGKSTFVQHLNGLLKPDSGRIMVGGTDIHATKEETRRARFRVGLVFQFPEYQLFEETVYKDIAFGPKNMGLRDSEIDERVREGARFVGLPESMLEKSPFELSGGYRRRAAIAGVIAMRPEVLILDEPTAGLDPQGRDELMDNIDSYRSALGATIIVVTHSMEEVARRAERVFVFEDGVIAMRGTPTEVFRHGEKLYAMGLGVPKSAQLADRLRALGVPLGGDIYTPEGILDAVIAIRERGDFNAS